VDPAFGSLLSADDETAQNDLRAYTALSIE